MPRRFQRPLVLISVNSRALLTAIASGSSLDSALERVVMPKTNLSLDYLRRAFWYWAAKMGFRTTADLVEYIVVNGVPGGKGPLRHHDFFGARQTTRPVTRPYTSGQSHFNHATTVQAEPVVSGRLSTKRSAPRISINERMKNLTKTKGTSNDT